MEQLVGVLQFIKTYNMVLAKKKKEYMQNQPDIEKVEEVEEVEEVYSNIEEASLSLDEENQCSTSLKRSFSDTVIYSIKKWWSSFHEK